ncbi:MAG: Signal recognition particle protein [Chlamydiia bacterium]|nr:Signal recognition particle protein [Chlamydiia bacterium]MCH9615951.1 Signal recognition particle protein [Chlamydiia bacterium]MCH9628646.1 Signal recognition particle protein [Chlamydiia bacterium]
MFGSLTERFQSLFQKKLNEDNLKEAVREVRLALLDADVNYSVASTFVKRVKEKVIGEKVLKSIKAKDQFIKIVHDELTDLMGADEHTVDVNRNPSVIMLCGLQGSGKTTTAAKLALYLKNQKKRVLLAACDLQRLAAVDQLKTLGEQIGVEVESEGKNPVKVAKNALERAKKEAFDVLIVDTAGRLHIDTELMDELLQMKKVLCPHETFFIANSATGQDAVTTATQFDEKVSITGSILTMLDGSTRAGAAISIREVTGKPLVFEGVGERVEDFQLFHPASMADRILGMGDVINLVKRAEGLMDEKESKELERKFKKAAFTYQDYLKQMGMIKKMGSLKGMLKMMPGFSQMEDMELDDSELGRVEAMILSMTQKERDGLVDLEMSRRRRIAGGAGVHLDDVNRMIKGFKRIKQFMKKFPAKKLSKLSLPGL